MGALHEGHLSLISQAKSSCDIVVCSIFVNPTQFNDPADLERYPRPIADDIEKLDHICDVLFLPPVDEMYPGNEEWHIDLGNLEHILEGEYRPGHYQGVTQIVKKLFDTVKPDKAFFGQKDYQQFKVIERLVRQYKMPVELIMCPIIREKDGLAMSSRNMHLSDREHSDALALSQTLQDLRKRFDPAHFADLKADAKKRLNTSPGIQLEYLEICDASTLETANANTTTFVALLAAWVGKTRLIDNVILN